MASQKFRLNKSSLDSRRYQWQEEENIDDVLEQERNAWLNHLSEHATDNDTIRARGSRHGVQPSVSLPDTEDYMDWQGTPARGSSTYDMSGYMSAPENPTRPSITTRKSFFKEGSMSEASKATASTWTDQQVDNSRPSSFASSSYLEDTPRSSKTSRASISSSLDINEFKPLPEPPSTIKNTIKRFSQKLKSTKTDLKQEPVDRVDFGTIKASKKGLRKSMSTWFNNPGESNTDDESSVPPTPESIKPSRSIHNLKTLRFRNRGRVEKKSDDQTKSILDDRKRKAEIAYAEQFGTARHSAQIAAQPDSSEPATVRRSDRLQGLSVKNATAAQQLQRSEIIAQQTVEALMTDATNFNGHNMANTHTIYPPRSSSRNSNSSIESDTDRMKRRSRAETELEKENHHLRMELRKAEQRSLSRRRGNTSSTNWEVHADEDDPEEYTVVTPHSGTSTTGKRRRNDASTMRAVPESSDAPPVPPLPTLTHARPSLSTISGNQARVSDTSTMKRYGPVRPGGRAIELPRALSMVLEGKEDGSGSDEDQSETPRKRLKMSFDGASDAVPDSDIAVQGKVKQGEQWVWPDDVF